MAYNRYLVRWAVPYLASVLVATFAAAQERPAAQVADSAVAQAGQRQQRTQPIAGIQSLGRVNGRIQNRVQSRIRNRIDRNYDPQANAASPFVTADEQARTANSAGRN